jgi:acyl carrier protein
MNDEIFAQVKTFVAKFALVSEKELNPDTRLLDDLGIDGHDADELIVTFCEKFQIQDMSHINLSEYFGPESGNPILFLYDLLFAKEKARKTPITLRDLAFSAELKRWMLPDSRRRRKMNQKWR